MRVVLEFVMCSDADLDSHRFADQLDADIAAGTIKRFKAFTKWAADVRKRPKPTDPLAAAPSSKKSKGKSKKPDETQENGGDLFALIQGRNKQRMQFLHDLEDKYISKAENKGTKGKGKKAAAESFEEPSEEEFLAAQARMESKREAKRTKKK